MSLSRKALLLPLAVVLLVPVLGVTAGVAGAAVPAWCSGVTTGNPTNSETKTGWIGYTGAAAAAVNWPDTLPSDADADSCFEQQLGTAGLWPRNSVYPAHHFRVNGGTVCQSVITEGSFFTEGLDTWESLQAWMKDHFPTMGNIIEDMMGSNVSTPGFALFGVTCWVPQYFQAGNRGDLSVAALFPQANYTGATGCTPNDNFPGLYDLYGSMPTSNGWTECTVVAEDLGDVLRVHWVGTMTSFNMLEAAGEAHRAELTYADWGVINPTDPKVCVNPPGGCGYVTLIDTDVEVGILTGDDFALPNAPDVPGWIDQSLLGGCRLLNFTGDDVSGATWSGGEEVSFTASYLEGVERTETFPAGVVVTLGELAGDPVSVSVVTVLPGSFTVVVPEVDAPLTPMVSFDVTAGACHSVSYYDPTGAGGAPGSATQRMGFSECVETGLDGAIPEASGITDVALEAATWIVCGVYTLFVPERGFSYHLAGAQVAAKSGAFADLVSAWQSGGRVVQSVSASGGGTPASFTLAGASVSIPAPSGTALTVVRLLLAVSVLVGGGLRGIRLLLRSFGAPAPEASSDDTGQRAGGSDGWDYDAGTWVHGHDGDAVWELNRDD